jgi:hypothetical protein
MTVMPKGPQGQKRPTDVIARAVLIGKIATGEAEESIDGSKAQRKGGRTRAKKLTPEERSKIASVAAQARWKKG